MRNSRKRETGTTRRREKKTAHHTAEILIENE
jgi:hypothetical protein